MPWLINAAQLDKFRKNQKNLIILDASLHLHDRDSKKEFIEKHILGAQFFPIEELSDPNALLPYTLLQNETLINEKLGKLGIRNDYKIILYDNSDLHSACRALWMLKIFGHNPHLLYILDGGLKGWETYGGKVESGEASFSPKTYTSKIQTEFLRSLSDIKLNLQLQKEQIVDLRHAVRYAGGKEWREGIRSGHIPGSFCLPYTILFDKEGCFLPLEKVKKKLIDIGVDLQVPITTCCGSGITAPILNFLLDLLSLKNNALYDGSWTEYGSAALLAGEESLEERPVETCVDK